MMTLNPKMGYCPRTAAEPAFSGSNKLAGAPSAEDIQQQNRQRFLNLQRLQERKRQEAKTQRTLAEWGEFQDKFKSYSAPSVKKAADQMTEALKKQAHLEQMYTKGARERYEEGGKVINSKKMLLNLKAKLGLH